MKTISFMLNDLTCPSCSSHLEGLMKKMKGVSNVRILFALSRMKVEYDETLTNPSLLVQMIERAGYHAKQGAVS